MKTKGIRLLAMLLLLAMVFSLAACDLGFGSGSKVSEDDGEDQKKTETKASDMANYEKRLDSLERGYELSYNRLTHQERNEAVYKLQDRYGANIGSEMVKGYKVEKNDRLAYVFEFKKTTDAQSVEMVLENALRNDQELEEHFGDKTYGTDVERKNCVVIFGSVNLVEMITNSKSQTAPMTPDHTGEPTHTYEGTDYPYNTVEPSYTDESDANQVISDNMQTFISEMKYQYTKKKLTDYYEAGAERRKELAESLRYFGVELKGEITMVYEAVRDDAYGYKTVTVIDFSEEIDAENALWALLDANSNSSNGVYRWGNVILLGNSELIDLLTQNI